MWLHKLGTARLAEGVICDPELLLPNILVFVDEYINLLSVVGVPFNLRLIFGPLLKGGGVSTTRPHVG